MVGKNKNSSKVSPNEASPVHIKIDNPIDLRKVILGAAIDATKMLKDYSEIKSLRDMKFSLIKSYGDLQLDMKKIIKNLEKGGLPAVNFHKFHLDEDIIPNEEIITDKNNVANDEIEKLKSELLDIEKKLNHL